jgi:hypothetical protein
MFAHRHNVLRLAVVFAAAALLPGAPAAKGGDDPGWKPHVVKQGDGRGGWALHSGECRFLRKPGGRYTMPFGLAVMDNGEVILAASWHPGKDEKPATGIIPEKPVLASSRDRGDTWTDFALIPDGAGRPVMLTYLGKGDLTFQTDGVNPVTQYFSKDHGKTWTDRKALQAAVNKGTHVDGKSQPGYWGAEGNNLVDRDARGVATRVWQVGWNYDPGSSHPVAPANGMLRWSEDGCRSWSKETLPGAWRFKVEHEGKTHVRGVSEGSLVRAANGWLVAALRTDMPPRYFDTPGREDSLEGTGVSISKDEGATWSPIRVLFDAGRHHAHLLRLANGDLVMTLIVRVDVQGGRPASYRRGCEAVVSHDNGLTWDLDHKYILDEYEFSDGVQWFHGECGHLCTALLDDGSLLTCYGNYLSKGACLIRWRPTPAEKSAPPPK